MGRNVLQQKIVQSPIQLSSFKFDDRGSSKYAARSKGRSKFIPISEVSLHVLLYHYRASRVSRPGMKCIIVYTIFIQPIDRQTAEKGLKRARRDQRS
jgi:hypothetical protein